MTQAQLVAEDWAAERASRAAAQAREIQAAIQQCIGVTPSGLRRVLLTDASIELDRVIENITKARNAQA